MIRSLYAKPTKKGQLQKRHMIDLYITHRFSMSSENIERFIDALDELKADLKRLKKKDGTEKETDKSEMPSDKG